MTDDKIFIEKKEGIRLILRQEIGFSKIVAKIREEYLVKELVDDGEIILLVDLTEPQ